MGELATRSDLFRLLALSAAPGSTSHDGLRLLATWAATARVDAAPTL